MKTTKKLFAKMLTMVTMLAVLFLYGCDAGSENEGLNPNPNPNPTPTQLSFNLLEDGVVDSTYTVGVSELYTKGAYALVYDVINKESKEKVGETKTYIAPYLASAVVTVTGDKAKVASKALEVYDVKVSETVKGNPVKNANSYRYNTEKTVSLQIKTVAENGAEAKDVFVSGKLIFPRDEVFFDGETNRILDVAYLGIKSVEFSKFTLDSLKAKTTRGQEAYYSFHFNVTRQATFFASKRYEWGSKMKTRSSVAGDDVEVVNSVFYNDPEPITNVVKAVVMLYVPEDGKEPTETGVTYEDDKLAPKEGTEYYTSSNNKYRNYDDKTKVLDKHNEVDILVTAALDSDPAIILVDNIASIGAPTFKKTPATKTSKTIGEYYIETQKNSFSWTWPYGKGSVSRKISTVEEYPFIIDGAKKIKMLSSTWEAELKSSVMDKGVAYTYEGKKSTLYTQENVWDLTYYNEIRTFTGKNYFVVIDTEEAKQKGWEIFNSDYKKVDDSFYNTFGDLYKIFDDDTKTLSEALSLNYNVTAAIDADGSVILIDAESEIGSPKITVADGTTTNRTSGKFFIETLPKTYTATWTGKAGVVRKVFTVEESVNYMAGATKLPMKTGSWDKVELTPSIKVTSGTHGGKNGKFYTESVVPKATYGKEVRTLKTMVNTYFMASPDPAVVTVSEVSKDYTVQTTDVKSWINLNISTLYNGQTTSKDSIATDYLNFGFEAAANKNFKKSAEGLDVSSTNVSKSTSVAGTKTTNKLDLDVILKFIDGSASTITFPGFYTTGYVTIRGKKFDYKAPQMSVSYSRVEKVGNTTSVEEGGILYKRSTYKVVAVATVDGKTISRETTITVDVEVKQQVNPDKGKFLHAYKTYTPSLDNALHDAWVITWEKKIDMIVDNAYYETVNNPDPSKVYQSVACRRSGSGWSWSPAIVSLPGTGWWRYTDANDATYRIDWSWQINGSLLGKTFKEGDWNQTTGNSIVKTIDENGFTTITAYASDGSVIYVSK